VKPAAHGRSGRNSIRIFYQWSGVVQRTVLFVVSLQRVAARDQTVVRIGKGERWKKGHSLPTTCAESASNANPVVVFVMCLLAPATVTDDGIAFANRASPQQDLLAVASPIGFELVRQDGKWDKNNRASWGLYSGIAPPKI
jgi:hypothetical protein